MCAPKFKVRAPDLRPRAKISKKGGPSPTAFAPTQTLPQRAMQPGECSQQSGGTSSWMCCLCSLPGSASAARARCAQHAEALALLCMGGPLGPEARHTTVGNSALVSVVKPGNQRAASRSSLTVMSPSACSTAGEASRCAGDLSPALLLSVPAIRAWKSSSWALIQS